MRVSAVTSPFGFQPRATRGPATPRFLESQLEEVPGEFVLAELVENPGEFLSAARSDFGQAGGGERAAAAQVGDEGNGFLPAAEGESDPHGIGNELQTSGRRALDMSRLAKVGEGPPRLAGFFVDAGGFDRLLGVQSFGWWRPALKFGLSLREAAGATPRPEKIPASVVRIFDWT